MPSKIIWQGGAAAVAQVDSLTPGGTIEADDLFLVTLTAEDGTTHVLSVAAGATTITATVDAIVAAFNACTDARFTPITASRTGAGDASYVLLTADVAGVPFACAVATTEAGGGAADAQTFVRAAVTASCGPNDGSLAANYRDGAAPAAGDELSFEASAVDCLYGRALLTTFTLGSVRWTQSYTGKFGGAIFPLLIKATLAEIGENYDANTPAGSTRINVDFSTVQTTVTVFNTAATSADTGLRPVRIRGTHAANVLHVRKGLVALAASRSDETSQFSAVNVSWTTNQFGDADVTIGAGVTLATLTQTGGTVALRCAATTVNAWAGKLTTAGTGAITTVNAKGAAITANSTGTIGTLNAQAGSVDFTKSTSARTVSAVAFPAGATCRVAWDPAVLTMAAPTFAGPVTLQAA